MRIAACCCSRRVRILRPTVIRRSWPTRISSQARLPSIGATIPRTLPGWATTSPCPAGRVIGGSSAVNGAVAIRARPADFARWARRGIEGWSWEEVFVAYKALENTPAGDDAWHGRSGPFPIRQRTSEENTPSMRAFVEAAEAAGLPHVSDFN